jgi:hypothetical protein
LVSLSSLSTLLCLLLTLFSVPSTSQIRPPLACISQNSPSIPSVVVLSGQAGISSLDIALQTLVYTCSNLNPNHFQNAIQHHHHNATTASFRSWTTFYQDVVLSRPETKFILPISDKVNAALKTDKIRQPCAHSWLGMAMRGGEEPEKQEELNSGDHVEAVQKYFREQQLESKLLVFPIDESRDAGVGDRWAELCNFLQLGYSIVERLRRHTFPRVTEDYWL